MVKNPQNLGFPRYFWTVSPSFQVNPQKNGERWWPHILKHQLTGIAASRKGKRTMDKIWMKNMKINVYVYIYMYNYICIINIMSVSLFHCSGWTPPIRFHTSPWAWPDSATTSYAPGAAVHLSLDVFWSWKLLFSVGKTGCHLHHPPVITINIIKYIGGMVTIPGHGWFIFVLTTSWWFMTRNDGLSKLSMVFKWELFGK